MKKKWFLLIAMTILSVPSLIADLFSNDQVLAIESEKKTSVIQSAADESIISAVPDESLRFFLANTIGKNVESLDVSDLEKVTAISINRNNPESLSFMKVKDFTGLERTKATILAIQNLTAEETKTLMAVDFEEMGKYIKFSDVSFSQNKFENGIDFSRLVPVFSDDSCEIQATQNVINTRHNLIKENYNQLVVETKDFGLIMPDGLPFEYKKYFPDIFVNNSMTFYDLGNMSANEENNFSLNYCFEEISYLESDMLSPSDKYVYNLVAADSFDYDSLVGKTFSNDSPNLEFGHGSVFDFSDTIQFNFDYNYIYSHIYFEPEIKKSTVTVEHIDESGQELVVSEKIIGVVGEEYKTTPEEIPGYELVETPPNATGTFAEEPITVTYKYKKSEPAPQRGTVTIKYVDENGQELIDSDELTGEVGSEYTTKAKDIPGYELVETPSNATGTFTEGDIVVVYVYGQESVPAPQRGTVTIKYVDENGQELIGSNELSGIIGEEYKTTPEEIAGYELVETPSNAAGTFAEEPITVTYKYKKSEPAPQRGTVTIKYVDENGQELIGSNELSGIVGEEYKTTPEEIAGYELVETPSNAAGTFAEEPITVTYKYKKSEPAPQRGTVTIKYVDENGQEVIGSDELTGEVGSEYTTKAKDIPGYELVETPSNATGTFTEGDIVVVYVYGQESVPAPQRGTVTIKYVDENGQELIGSDELSGEVGSEYTTKAKDIPGYELVETPSNATGTFTEGDIVVVYVYGQESVPAPQRGTVTIKYVDENGQELIGSDELSGEVGSEYTTKAKDIPGYELVETPSNATGTFTEGDIVVVYVYGQESVPAPQRGTVTIKYVDENGQELIGSDELSGEVGSEYTTKAKDIPGYELVETPSNATGTFTEGDIVVVYVYGQESVPAPQRGTVTIKYVDENGQELIGSDELSGEVGSEYTTKAKDIPGYELVETPSNATGTFTEGDIVVVYVYGQESVPAPQRGTVTIKYVDENGQELIGSDELSGEVGSEYTTKAKDIPGYELVETPSNATGTFTEGDIVVVYVYGQESVPAPQRGTVTIKYVDENGQELIGSNELSGIIGEEYKTTPEEIAGYELVETPSNAAGTFAEEPITVTYKYKKSEPAPQRGTVTIKYVDENGQEVIGSDELTGEVGSEYTTKAKDIPGYELVETPSNATGTFTEGDIVVVYVYGQESVPAPQRGTVTIKYVDENGQELIGSDELSGIVGEEYKTTPEEIAGYELVETPPNATGTFAEEPITVTYKYKKSEPAPQRGTVTIKYVDENGQELIGSNELSGIVGEEYKTTPEEIAGYELVETPSNATGTFTEGDIVVTYTYKLVEIPQKDEQDPNTPDKIQTTDKVTVNDKVLPKTGESSATIGTQLLGIMLIGVIILGTAVKKRL